MQYKNYNSSHLKSVIDLLNICFAGKKITAESFLWKHFDAFFENKTLGMVAVDKDKVCSFVCFTPVNIRKNSRVYNKFYTCAVQATHPDYRRRGIVSKLTQKIEKKLGPDAGYIGFSNSEGVKIDKYSKKINYQILGKLATTYIPALQHNACLTINPISKIPSLSIVPLYASINKDKKYLNWRYEANPKNNYRYFEVKNKKRIGLVVCKETKNKYEISDLLLKRNSPKIFAETIKAFSNFAAMNGKKMVSYCYLKNKFWDKCFPFISWTKNVKIYFTVKSNDASLLKADSWLVQGGDVQ